jgi:DNA-3-methyladenine glycosylase I
VSDAPDSMRVGPGPDGLERCWWCLGAPEYIDYHDRLWGRPIHDERFLFEMLTLESFQSGLSWLTILRKRDGFRVAFDDWEIDKIADYGEQDIARLLADTGIVRNRAKIEAAIANAGAVRALQTAGESLDDLVWRFAPDAAPAPRSGAELQATTPASTAMAKELKRRGFRFVGPTTAYAFMEAAGLVNDHLAGCAFRGLPLRTPVRQ